MLGAEPRDALAARAALSPAGAWERLRARVSAQAGWLCSPLPAGRGVCRTCRGPADPGFARCFQCDQHASRAPGLLAETVVPVSYAVKGGPHAGNLWRYKSGLPDAAAAGAALLPLLLVFLRDHGSCVWRAAGSGPPTHVATVPSTRGRPGPHPLEVMVGRCLRLPRAGLAVASPSSPDAPSPPALPRPQGPASPPCQLSPQRLPGSPSLVGSLSRPDPLEPDDREVQPELFAAGERLDQARVLLLDDTWTTGARAQSAAAAAKLAGAQSVAIVVLGRHLNPADVAGQPFGPALSGHGFRPDACAVHALQ